jgi:hypothetical protein
VQRTGRLPVFKETHDGVMWRCQTVVDKFEGDPTLEERERGLILPFETVEREGNLLVIGGASALWERLIGTSITAFDNTNANIGVGDSTTAAADTQTDLQAATNKLRKAVDATYPQHTDSTGTAGSKSIVYRATFATTDANFAWQEWAIFNAAAAGRMLNRKVESLGTKTSAATWVLTITLSLA